MLKTYLDRAIKRLASNPQPQDSQKVERSLRSLEALAFKRYQQAYDLGISNGIELPHRGPMFVAGVAALHLQRWQDAVKLFEALVTFDIRLGLNTQPILCRIMLGRALAGAGRAAEARKAYEEAFRIWKDADADLPALVEARREYGRLSS